MDVQFLVGNLIKLEVDAIVNPANSEGEMGGGVAAAIKKGGGAVIEKEAMEKAPIPIGKAVLTTSGKLKCQFIVHVPTMKVPVQKTSVENISRATLAALRTAREYDFETLAMPGMGTGSGKVPVTDAAAAMIETIKKYFTGQTRLKELILVDKNKEMVAAWETSWYQPEEQEA